MTVKNNRGDTMLHKFLEYVSCILVQLYSSRETGMHVTKILRFDWSAVFCWRSVSYLLWVV